MGRLGTVGVMIAATYRTYSIYAGGESCLESGMDLNRLLERWKDLYMLNFYIRPDMNSWTIKEKVAETPQRGQLLIGHFDVSFVPPDSSVRRNPRGYMLMWEEITIED